jgi:hypothetical protein
MNKIIITEGDLASPVFQGSDEEISQAVSMWSGIIGSLAYMSSLQSEENKRNMIISLVAFLNSKLEASVPVVPPVHIYQQTLVAPVVPPADNTSQDSEIVVTYESLKEQTENPIVKRMRELAGVPHHSNRV